MQLPTYQVMIRNLLFTTKNVIKYAIIKRQLKLEKNKQKERLQICNCCTYKLKNRCSQCGCYIEAKASLIASECPANKWDCIK